MSQELHLHSQLILQDIPHLVEAELLYWRIFLEQMMNSQTDATIHAGDENAISRVLLGVHFRMDCDAGVELGRQVASRILTKIPWKK